MQELITGRWGFRIYCLSQVFFQILVSDVTLGGPTPDELMHLVDQCNLTNSRATTPSVSPSPYFVANDGLCTPQASRHRLMEAGYTAAEVVNDLPLAERTAAAAELIDSAEDDKEIKD